MTLLPEPGRSLLFVMPHLSSWLYLFNNVACMPPSKLTFSVHRLNKSQKPCTALWNCTDSFIHIKFSSAVCYSLFPHLPFTYCTCGEATLLQKTTYLVLASLWKNWVTKNGKARCQYRHIFPANYEIFIFLYAGEVFWFLEGDVNKKSLLIPGVKPFPAWGNEKGLPPWTVRLFRHGGWKRCLSRDRRQSAM